MKTNTFNDRQRGVSSLDLGRSVQTVPAPFLSPHQTLANSRLMMAGLALHQNCTHFVGFRDDRYWNAVAVFGVPDFIHMGWDLRARRELAPGDLVVFATGDESQAPSMRSFPDIHEPEALPSPFKGGLA